MKRPSPVKPSLAELARLITQPEYLAAAARPIGSILDDAGVSERSYTALDAFIQEVEITTIGELVAVVAHAETSMNKSLGVTSIERLSSALHRAIVHGATKKAAGHDPVAPRLDESPPDPLDAPPVLLPSEAFPTATLRAMVQGSRYVPTVRAYLATMTEASTPAVAERVQGVVNDWMPVALAAAAKETAFRALEATELPDLAGLRALDARLATELDRSTKESIWIHEPTTVTFDAQSGRILADVRVVYSGYSHEPYVITLRSPPVHSRFMPLPPYALRAAQRFLRTPDAPGHAELLAWLAIPPWKWALDDFQALIERFGVGSPAVAESPTSRFAFRVTASDSDVGVDVLLQTLGKRGTWTRGKVPSRSDWESLRRGADAVDQRVLDGMDVLTALAKLYDPGSAAMEKFLGILAGHPRVYCGDVQVTLRRAAVCLEFVPTPDGLIPQVRVGTRTCDPKTLTCLAKDGTVLSLDTPAMVLSFGVLPSASLRLLAVCRKTPTAFPEASWGALLARIEALGTAMPVILPRELEGAPIDARAEVLVHLRYDDSRVLHTELAIHVRGYFSRLPVGDGPPRVYATDQGRRSVFERNLEQEILDAHAISESLGLATHAEPTDVRLVNWTSVHPESVLSIVEAAKGLPADVEVRWSSPPVRIGSPIGAKAVRVRVASGAGFFTIGGDATVDEQTVSLMDVAAALRRGERYVALGANHFARITDDLRAKLAPIADVATTKGNTLQLAATALPFIGELAEASGDATLNPDVRARLKAWEDAGVTTVDPPTHLTGILRPYQVEGFAWLARLAAWGAGAVLADDMGLGKTLQSIALLEHRAELGPALVIAPTSVGPNWEIELARFGKKLRVHRYRGPARGELLKNLGKGDLLVTSWDLAVRDEDALAAITFSTVVFDEAQAAKNAASRRANMACSLKADFRVALSGTPIENHLGELWSLFSFTLPGLLGGPERFRQHFATPIERDGSPEKRRVLASLVRPFVLRRTKEKVEQELPSLTETTNWVEFSQAERSLYEAMRREAMASLEPKVGDKKDHLAFLVWLTRLRQLACHPRLALKESTVPSSKLAAIMEVVEALRAEKHRMLVFSQFTEHLALLRAKLDHARIRYQYLDGSTPAEERAVRVKAFQAGEGELFLLSLKAGGVGLNLTAASHVLHLDPWWNPASEDQATDRAHRIGQDKPVTAIRFVTRGTVEEAIVGVRERKRELAESVLEGTDLAARLSQAELLDLMRTGSAEAFEDQDATS